MIPIPASILAIENESDRDFMENIFFSYQRLIYHEIGSILNDPWSKDDIFQTVIVQLINNISLKDYSDDNIESIKAAVLSHGGKTDYLNFIDDSNNVITCWEQHLERP